MQLKFCHQSSEIRIETGETVVKYFVYSFLLSLDIVILIFNEILCSRQNDV